MSVSVSKINFMADAADIKKEQVSKTEQPTQTAVQNPLNEQKDSFEHKGNTEAENISKQQNQQQEKKKTLKNRVASIAKFFTATEEITKGTAKGAIYGTLTGGLIMAFGWFKAIPQGFKKGNSIIKVFKHPFQVIGSKTKITAGITAVGIAAYNIVKGFLQANQRRAFIDQKLRTN